VWTRAFPGVDATQLVALELSGPAGRLSLERADGLWRLGAPLQAEADAEAVQDALDALVHVELGEPFTGRAAADYGLATPRITVQATLESGEVLRLDLGDDSPAGGGTYVRDRAGALRLSRSPLALALPLDADAWRNRELLRFARSAVTRLSLDRPTGRVELVKDDRGWWLGASERRVRADADRVDQLLEALANLRVERFADAPLALDAPWTIALQSGDDPPAKLILGTSTGSLRPALGPLQDQPVEVRADALLDAIGAEGAFADRSLLPFDGATAHQLDLRMGAAEFQAQRSGSGWTPAGADAVIGALQDVAADRQRMDLPAPEGEPWGRIALAETDGKVSAVLIYQELPGGRLAVEEAGGAPFFLSSTALGQLAVALPVAD
jgi:hypothetical protein